MPASIAAKHSLDETAFGVEIAMRRRPGNDIVYTSEILGCAELRGRRAEQHDCIAFGREVRARDAIDIDR